MYRAVGLAAERWGITLPISDPEEVARIAGSVRVELIPSP